MNTDQLFSAFLIGSFLKDFLRKIKPRHRMSDLGTVITKAVWKAATQPTLNRYLVVDLDRSQVSCILWNVTGLILSLLGLILLILIQCNQCQFHLSQKKS